MSEPSIDYLMLEQLKGLRSDVQGVRAETIAVRTELKAEIGSLRDEVHITNERLDITNKRLDVVETTLRDLAAQLLILGRFVRNVSDKYDRDLEDVKARLRKVEDKLGA